MERKIIPRREEKRAAEFPDGQEELQFRQLVIRGTPDAFFGSGEPTLFARCYLGKLRVCQTEVLLAWSAMTESLLFLLLPGTVDGTRTRDLLCFQRGLYRWDTTAQSRIYLKRPESLGFTD